MNNVEDFLNPQLFRDNFTHEIVKTNPMKRRLASFSHFCDS